jgi:hypothetical protein
MPVTDLVTIIGNISQAFIIFVAALTLFLTVRQYRRDQSRQRAAQTWEDLQAIIGDCNRLVWLVPPTKDAMLCICAQCPGQLAHFCSCISQKYILY